MPTCARDVQMIRLTPPTADLPTPSALARLAAQRCAGASGERAAGAALGGRPFYPLRPTGEVVAGILEGRAPRITELWRAFGDVAYWGHPSGLGMAQQVWRCSSGARTVREALVWQVALALGGASDKCAPELVRSVPDTSPAAHLREHDIPTWARTCFSTHATPRRAFMDRGLPPALRIVWSIAVDCARLFAEEAEPGSDGWMIATLESVPFEYQDKAVSVLLGAISAERSREFPEVRTWILDRYSRLAKTERLGALDAPATRALADWMGALGYEDFYELVVLVISDLCPTRELPELRRKWDQTEPRSLSRSELEAKHIWRRALFWSDYGNSILRARFFLPVRTGRLAEKASTVRYSNVTVGEEFDVEAVMLDLGTVVVADCLRGPSQILFFEPAIGRRLLEQATLTKQQLEEHAADTYPDHGEWWQKAVGALLKKRWRLGDHPKGTPKKRGKSPSSAAPPAPQWTSKPAPPAPTPLVPQIVTKRGVRRAGVVDE